MKNEVKTARIRILWIVLLMLVIGAIVGRWSTRAGLIVSSVGLFVRLIAGLPQVYELLTSLRKGVTRELIVDVVLWFGFLLLTISAYVVGVYFFVMILALVAIEYVMLRKQR